MKRITPIFWSLLVLATAVSAYWIYNSISAPVTNAAIGDGSFSTQITMGGGGNSATIILTRADGVTGTVKVAIPSGTILYGSNSDQQRLITAVPIAVELTDAAPSVTQQVSTFCIDEFSDTPGFNAALSFTPPPNGSHYAEAETEPLQKLAKCMASAPQSDADKQLAVWAVTSEMLHKTPEEVLRFVADGLAQQMAKERHDQLDQEKKPEIKRTHPSLSDDLINKLIAAEYEEGMPELRKIANTKAGEQMDSFLGHDKELLISCGFASSDMPIFG